MSTQIHQKFDNTIADLTYGPVVDESGRELAITSAAVDVLLDDNTQVVTSGVGTITNGWISYNWTSGEETTLRERIPRTDCRARWTIVTPDGTFERTQYFDLRAVEIRTNVTDSMICKAYPALLDNRVTITGSATDGTTTDLIDESALYSYPSNYFTGSILRMITGVNQDNRGMERIITIHDRATATLTVDPAFPFAINEGDTYEVQVSYNNFINRAWDEIQSRVLNWLGELRYMQLLDGIDFERAHLNLSIALILESLAQNRDPFEAAAKRFRQDYEAAMQSCKAKYDARSQAVTGQDFPDVAKLNILRYFGK